MIKSAVEDVRFYIFIVVIILIMSSFFTAVKNLDLGDSTKQIIEKQEKQFYQEIWFIVTIWGIIGTIGLVIIIYKLYEKYGGGFI